MKWIKLFEDFQLGDLNFMSPEEIEELFFRECEEATPDLELIRVIIENGLVDVDAKDRDGETPLHLAKNIELAKLLITSGADVDAKNEYSSTPLHWAVYGNNIAIAKLLIASGADVNAKGFFGRMPLHVAVGRGNIAIAKLLIASGAKVNTKNDFGETPLHVAKSEEMRDLLMGN